MLIAIDGPAGAGKSTVAKALAERYGLTYLDSGAMYRCVALQARRERVDPADAEQVSRIAEAVRIEMAPGRISLDGADVTAEIRLPSVSGVASQVSVHAAVREAMVGQQRQLTEAGRWVAEGRDIGTVVRPDAQLKVFLTASEAERARRRAAETGEEVDAVLTAMRERDRRDRTREHGALHAAADAIELDTTGLSLDQVTERIGELAVKRGLL